MLRKAAFLVTDTLCRVRNGNLGQFCQINASTGLQMKPFWRLYGGWKKLTKLWREQKRSCVKSKTRSMRYTKGGTLFVTTGSRLWAGIGNVGNVGNVGNAGIGNVGAKQGWYLLVSSTLILQITLFTETERLRDFVKTNTELIIGHCCTIYNGDISKFWIEVLML